jgi:hypothetical protein
VVLKRLCAPCARISPGYHQDIKRCFQSEEIRRRKPSAAFGRSRDSATDSPTDGAPPPKNGRPFRKGAAAMDGGALRTNAAAKAARPSADVGRALGTYRDSLFQCISARQDIARHRIRRPADIGGISRTWLPRVIRLQGCSEYLPELRRDAGQDESSNPVHAEPPMATRVEMKAWLAKFGVAASASASAAAPGGAGTKAPQSAEPMAGRPSRATGTVKTRFGDFVYFVDSKPLEPVISEMSMSIPPQRICKHLSKRPATNWRSSRSRVGDF